MNTNKKYTMIVTEENDKNNNLGFFADKPWEGNLSDVVFGDNVIELFKSSDNQSNEGLFYMLYSNNNGKRIGYGIVDYDSVMEDIDEYERSRVKRRSQERFLVKDYIGFWSIIDDFKQYIMLEHNDYGDETCYLIVKKGTSVDKTYILKRTGERIVIPTFEDIICETYDGIISALIEEELI